MKVQYSVLYQDPSLILADKPQGVATGFGENRNLCEMIFNDFPELKKVRGYNSNEGGLLNRLDNETGGIVLFAKHDDSFDYYSDLMKAEKIAKFYTAVSEGIPAHQKGMIDISLAHHFKNRKKMTVVSDHTKYRSTPREAKTEWELINTDDTLSLLNIRIRKGMRHQIRVHLAHIGLPIVGDKLYNKKKYPGIENHLLYAHGIQFVSLENKKIEIYTDVPFIKNRISDAVR